MFGTKQRPKFYAGGAVQYLYGRGKIRQDAGRIRYQADIKPLQRFETAADQNLGTRSHCRHLKTLPFRLETSRDHNKPLGAHGDG